VLLAWITWLLLVVVVQEVHKTMLLLLVQVEQVGLERGLCLL
jgi:hypothetical protein